MPDYKFSYLFGALVFLLAWLLCWLLPVRRRALLWGSLVAAPFAFTGIFFVPEYWSPPSILYLLPNHKMCLEDWFWSAAVGGIAAVSNDRLFEAHLTQARLVTTRQSNIGLIYWDRWIPIGFAVICFLALERFFPRQSIYTMSLSFVAASTITAVRRPDLRFQILRGGILFAAIYLLLFLFILVFYPDFVDKYWALENLWGIRILKVPVEELLFAASGGALWSVGYEVTHGSNFFAQR